MEEYIKQLEEENFNLRQDILLNKISFPPKWTRDKTIYELYDMPTYDDLTNIVNKKLVILLERKETISYDDF